MSGLTSTLIEIDIAYNCLFNYYNQQERHEKPKYLDPETMSYIPT